MLASAGVSATRKAEESVDDTWTDADSRDAEDSLREVIAPHLFVALECDNPVAGVTRHSLANIDAVIVGRGSARSSDRSCVGGVRTLAIRLADPRASSQHARVFSRGAGFEVEDAGSRNGTRVNGRKITARTTLGDGDLIQIGHTLLRYRARVAVPLGEAADVDSARTDKANPLVTVDPWLARRATTLARVARSSSAVLLLGETGTGKEFLARAIHRLSARTGPFVAVNCGALPATLVEAQLFGHLRGAFSGASAHALGLLRSADRGTVLFDEIGDLPGPAQAALLRALQEHEVVPIGAVRPVDVDFRVVAATHRPLPALAERNEFRSDLLARLAGFTFMLPPLRERREDVGAFIAAFATGTDIRISPAAGCALLCYDWPLNVRELTQALQVASAMTQGDAIALSHLPSAVASFQWRSHQPSRETMLDDPIRETLVASLARHRGNVSEVARELGKARMQVQRWMKRLGINARSFRQQ